MQPRPNKRSRRPRTVESGVVLWRATDAENSLDINGVCTFPLASAEDAEGFTHTLRACTKEWFDTNLAKMLDSPPDSMFISSKGERYTDREKSRRLWMALPLQDKKDFVRQLDLSTELGMRLVFDPGFLANQPWVKTMTGNLFFTKAVSYVKMGNKGMGMANMAMSWSAKGFGKWAHIVPDMGLSLLMESMKRMEQLGLAPGLPQHFPHPIYKPPGGDALEIHHDQMAPSELLANLREHVQSEDPSTTGWVRKHGIQMLAHLHGGTGLDDGATFVVGPMTPRKLLICLDAYSTGRVGGAFAAWNGKARGKIELPWEDHLDEFNAILQEHGHESIGLLPAAPGQYTRGGFVVAFPVGWPHGSFANAKIEDRLAGKGSRLSVTLPVTMRSSKTQDADPRIADRLQAMAILSESGRSAEEYAAAESKIANDLKPYADGMTHLHPERVLDLIRHPDAPGQTGPYHQIIVKTKTVQKYLAMIEKVQREELSAE